MKRLVSRKQGLERIGAPLLLAAVALGTGVSCELAQADPVHEAQVAALGGERDGIPQGPFHRAGQPCNVCHGGQGPANTTFSFAGTVFAGQAPSTTSGGSIQIPSMGPAVTGVDQAGVGLIDSTGQTVLVITNCVGNFFVSPNQLNPVFPVRVAVSKGKQATVMNSHISREGSCAECHGRLGGPQNAGQVFLTSKAVPTCPDNIPPTTPLQ
ncbi:MAG: hypothetical protein JOZ69_12910 [Myxococcales bacterium]|nr:hypothetical protein [Myxococcales bacterium]